MNHEQLNNCKKLLAVGQRILDERLPLGFGLWACDSYACWLGWYARETEYSIEGTTKKEYTHFGLPENTCTPFFASAYNAADKPGPAAYTELERRMAILDDIIARAEAELRPKGLPESVTSIFQNTANTTGDPTCHS